jgi:predicted permease
MRRLRAWFFRLSGLFNRERRDREFAEEIESHLQMHIEDNVRSGMTPQEARRRALIKLGGIEQTKENYRDRRGLPLLETLMQDVRYGIRMLRKNPGFAAVAVLTLALGIGANTAIFSVVYAVMLRPLPYPDSDRLVMLWQTLPKQGLAEVPFSAADFIDVQKQNRVFEQTAAIFLDKPDYNLTGQGEPERVYGMAVSANLFTLLGMHPELGRVFLADEDRPGHEHVAVLSYRLWQRQFRGDPQAIGKTVTLDAQAFTIVGVMPLGFRFPPPMASVSKSFPVECDIWLPVVLDRSNRHYHPLAGIARLKPGITVTQARAEMEAIAGRLAAQYPDVDTGLGGTAYALSQQVTETVRPALLILLGAVTLVLLIACVNVANLLLSRAAVREREMAVRTALGASRGRVVRQGLVESMLLAGLGGGLGVSLAVWGIEVIRSLAGTVIPRVSEVGINGPILAFTGITAALTGLVFGLVPALKASRPNLNEFLRGSYGTTQGGHQRFRSVLVISEVGLALALLIGAGLLVRSFVHLEEVDPGFRPDHLLTLSLRLPESKYSKEGQLRDFYQQLLQRVQSLPGARTSGLVNSVPIAGWQGTTLVYVEGRPVPTSMTDTPMANYRVSSSDYFMTLGIPQVRGRLFTSHDAAGGPRVLLINETMARRLFPNQDPLGKQLRLDNPKNPLFTIVGVVGDIRSGGLDAPLESEMYTAYLQDPWSIMTLVVRTAGDPLALAPAVRNQVAALDKDQPIFNVKSMEEIMSESISPRRFNMLVVGMFSAIALVLATVGIYGVVSFSVSQRTNEIGIRMALGAGKQEVLSMILRLGLGLAVAGVVAGLAAAFVLNRFLSTLLFGVHPYDPVTFIVVPLLLIAVAVTACYIPACRATRVDPMAALHYE